MSERRRRIRMVTVFMILIILLLAGIWLEIKAEYRKISPEEMWEILKGGGTKSVRYTLLNLRLPRIFTSLLVGMGLAVSGCVIQGVSRNDMAEPGILGINAGAGLFVAAFLVLVPQSSVSLTVLLPVLAFAGSMAVAVLDYRLARTGQGISPRRLLLMGVAVSTAVSSVTTILMLRLPDSDYAFVQNWLSGSIWGANWQNVRLLFVSLLLLGLFVFYKSRTLNVLSLSYQTAVGLGAAVSRQTVILLGAAIAMSGLCCAVGGGLSFVGLVCPHMARRLVGPNYRILVPATVLTGSVLMTYADLISRTLLSPREIPVGIVAAVIGAPYFLYLLIKT